MTVAAAFYAKRNFRNCENFDGDAGTVACVR
jgi:hypothetical protein